MRENCTYSLSGGRWPARKRATSDPTPTKQPNKSGRPQAEVVEGRPLVKENTEQSNQCRTQSRESGSSGLERVREAAKKDTCGRNPPFVSDRALRRQTSKTGTVCVSGASTG